MTDSGWFIGVYERRYAHVLAYAARRVGPDAGHDVTAEVFLVVWRRQVRLEPEQELAWLYATARRIVANTLRADTRRRALGIRARAALAGGCVPLLDATEAVDAKIDVRRAIATLSPRDQEALLLVEWEGATDAVGAEVTGCSPAAFRARLHRARRRLALVLDGKLAAVGPAHRDVQRNLPAPQTFGTKETRYE